MFRMIILNFASEGELLLALFASIITSSDDRRGEDETIEFQLRSAKTKCLVVHLWATKHLAANFGDY